jgi:copper resistance protein C
MIRAFAWLAALTSLLTSPAFAHAFLERSDPPVGSSVPTAPHTLTLRFTEGVEPLFSSVEVSAANGTAVTIGKPNTASGNNRELMVSLPDLQRGRYTVTWHVTSVDTHKTQGSFKFSVGQ